MNPGTRPAGRGAGGARHRARRCVIQALYQWQLTGQDADEIAQQFRGGERLAGADRDYFDTAWGGVTADAAGLDAALSPFLDRAVEELDPVERNVLRLAAWELREENVPPAVVINEAVELAHLFGGTDGHSFVNAVLDKAARSWRSAAPEPGHST